MLTPSPKKQLLIWVLALLSLTGYIAIGYFLERTEPFPLLTFYFALFGAYYFIWETINHKDSWVQPKWFNLDLVSWLAILFRVSFILAIPNLSDDFYRFIWDGRLLVAGINPFSHLPSYYMEAENAIPGLTNELYTHLNSPGYFTIYPPVNQFIFWLSALISTDHIVGSVLIMRVFILIAEFGNIWLLPKVLEQYNLPKKAASLYLLNPLVIIEGVGNLHFEVMMFFFIILALWWLKKDKLILSALAIALAVATKLIPLMFMPFLPKPINLKRTAIYYASTGIALLILFLPLLSTELIEGLQSSLSLYYQKFEFNASIYFLLREQGFQEFGYNRIAFIGKDLVKWTFWLIIILAFWPLGKKPKLPTLFMFALGIYLLLSTTVHPWYIITLVGLSVFTNYRSPVLWSATTFMTYIGYSASGYDLPTWVLFVEYGSLAAFFLFELARELGFNHLVKLRIQ